MILKNTLEVALKDYEIAIAIIQGMNEPEAEEFLKKKVMHMGLCRNFRHVRGVTSMGVLVKTFGWQPIGGTYVTEGAPTVPVMISRLRLRIDKLKELLVK